MTPKTNRLKTDAERRTLELAQRLKKGGTFESTGGTHAGSTVVDALMNLSKVKGDLNRALRLAPDNWPYTKLCQNAVVLVDKMTAALNKATG